MKKYLMIALLLSPLNAVAQPAEQANAVHAYRNVMRAQYDARQQPVPVRSEEAQRIWDAYIQSIGRPANAPVTNSGTDAGPPLR